MSASEQATAFVQKHIVCSPEVSAVRRKDRRNPFPMAVREEAASVVAHYDSAQRSAPIGISIFYDRLGIENPGLLPPALTVGDLLRDISKLATRQWPGEFDALGLVEQWRISVTVFTEQVGRPSLDDTDYAIVDALSDGESRVTSALAEVIRSTPRASRARLARPVGTRSLREVGISLQAPRRRYFKAEL